MFNFLKLESLKNWGLKEKILASSILLISFCFYPYLFFPSATANDVLNITKIIAKAIFEDYFYLLWRFSLTCLVFLFVYGLFFQNIFQNLFKRICFLLNKYKRVCIVLIIGTTEFFLIYFYFADLSQYLQLFSSSASAAWIGTFATTLIASPVAFLIWSFRNADKKIDQDHREEDIRQTDFHKLEEWAASIPIELGSEIKNGEIEKNNVLQIAAIYQLSPFLRGEHGSRFVRPSMEIYRSLLANWGLSDLSVNPSQEIADLIRNKPRYIDAIHSIIKEDLEVFMNLQGLQQDSSVHLHDQWIPLRGIQLDGIYLNFAKASRINLYEASFKAASLQSSNFEGAVLDYVDFTYANVSGTSFQHASLNFTKFSNANIELSFFKDTYLASSNFKNAALQDANFSGASLDRSIFYSNRSALEDYFMNFAEMQKNFSAQFDNANLTLAIFSGANLNQSHFACANLSGAIFYGARLHLAKFFDINLGSLKFTKDDFNNWIQKDNVEFIRCYVYKHQFPEDYLRLFEKAGIEIRTREGYVLPEQIR